MTRAAYHARLRRLGTAGIYPFREPGHSPPGSGVIIPNRKKKARAAWGWTKKCQRDDQIDHSAIFTQ